MYIFDRWWNTELPLTTHNEEAMGSIMLWNIHPRDINYRAIESAVAWRQRPPCHPDQASERTKFLNNLIKIPVTFQHKDISNNSTAHK